VRNHGEKIKDMSRSVLPSKGRKGARDNRRIIHGRQRARELAAVTAYHRDADPESVTPDVRGTYGPDITLHGVGPPGTGQGRTAHPLGRGDYRR